MLLIGKGISGLEAAGELTTDPSITVISSCRKPRYIITKYSGAFPRMVPLYTLCCAP